MVSIAGLAVRWQGEEMAAPLNNPQPTKSSGGLHTLVKAEKLVQIALVLPTAVVVGWGGGALLDKWLHQHWIYIVGLLFGAAAGMVEAVRQALKAGN
jgi:F0F1-type ATP synthase assembly protein I